MDPLEIFAALAAAEAEIAKTPTGWPGPNGLEPSEPAPPPRKGHKPRWTGRPRRGSRGWKKRFGGES